MFPKQNLAYGSGPEGALALGQSRGRHSSIHRVYCADPSSALVAAPGAVQICGRRQGRSAAAVDTKAMVRESSSAEMDVNAVEIAGAASYLAAEGGPDLGGRGPAHLVTSRAASSCSETPAMPSGGSALVGSGRPKRLLSAAAAGLGALAAAALFPGLFDHGPPHRSARAEAAPMTAAPSAAPSLYFHGPGDDLLDFAPAGQRRP